MSAGGHPRRRGSGPAPARPEAARSSGRPVSARGAARRSGRAQTRRRIGITCYSHFGGSGVVATELGLALARRGWDVHFIAHRLPFRLRRFESNVFFHEVTPVTYPVFEQPPNNLALATKMVEVVENYGLDLLHVHYAMPFAASAYLARQLVLPRQLGVVTTLHGTDITVLGVEPAFFRITQFSLQSSDRVTAVSRFLAERARETLGITRPVEANGVFAAIPEAAISALKERFHFYVWDPAVSEVRWMCSHDTTEDDVFEFAAAVRAESARHIK